MKTQKEYFDLLPANGGEENGENVSKKIEKSIICSDFPIIFIILIVHKFDYYGIIEIFGCWGGKLASFRRE